MLSFRPSVKNFAPYMRGAAPALAACLIVAVTGTTFAQNPGGTVFGANDQTVGNGIKAAIKYGRVLVFFGGIVFAMAAAIRKGMGQQWTGQAVGSAMCFGFAGLAQLVYQFAQGQDVAIDASLGN